MTAIDERIVKVSLEINGELKVYQSPMYIKSTGSKFANPLQNEAKVAIGNLTKADRDYLLDATSPFNKNNTPKLLVLEAGRVSTGTTKIYQGNISKCQPTQPPDIMLEFTCQANQFNKGTMVATTMPSLAQLSAIAAKAAADNKLQLRFEATDKNISNFSFTGGQLRQVDKIGAVGGVDAFVDGNQLIVKDKNAPLIGQQRILDLDSGMVGIPQITEQGIKVTYLLDNETVLGGGLQIHSIVYPTVNGNYTIFKLGWDIASRDTPFYWTPEAVRLSDSGKAVVPSGVKKKKGKRK